MSPALVLKDAVLLKKTSLKTETGLNLLEGTLGDKPVMGSSGGHGCSPDLDLGLRNTFEI